MFQTEKLVNLVYGSTPERELTLDIIKPVADRSFPAIVFVHGGGWMAGDKSKAGGDWNATFAQYGFVCININFRLSGEAIFPAPLLDVKTAIRWVKENAALYNIDKEKIGIWGHSSGGHLSTLAALSADHPDFHSGSSTSEQVQAVAALAGPVNLVEMGTWHDNPNSPESNLFGGRIVDKKEEAQFANPIRYITHDAPPILLIHGASDVMCPVEQSRMLHEALPNSTYLEIKGADHDFISGTMTIHEILDFVLSFFTKTLVTGLMGEEESKNHQIEVEQVLNWFIERSK